VGEGGGAQLVVIGQVEETDHWHKAQKETSLKGKEKNKEMKNKEMEGSRSTKFAEAGRALSKNVTLLDSMLDGRPPRDDWAAWVRHWKAVAIHTRRSVNGCGQGDVDVLRLFLKQTKWGPEEGGKQAAGRPVGHNTEGDAVGTNPNRPLCPLQRDTTSHAAAALAQGVEDLGLLLSCFTGECVITKLVKAFHTAIPQAEAKGMGSLFSSVTHELLRQRQKLLLATEFDKLVGLMQLCPDEELSPLERSNTVLGRLLHLWQGLVGLCEKRNAMPEWLDEDSRDFLEEVVSPPLALAVVLLEHCTSWSFIGKWCRLIDMGFGLASHQWLKALIFDFFEGAVSAGLVTTMVTMYHVGAPGPAGLQIYRFMSHESQPLPPGEEEHDTDPVGMWSMHPAPQPLENPQLMGPDDVFMGTFYPGDGHLEWSCKLADLEYPYDVMHEDDILLGRVNSGNRKHQDQLIVKSEQEGPTSGHPPVTPSAAAPVQGQTDPLVKPECRHSRRTSAAREAPPMTVAKRGAPEVVTNVVGVVTGVAGRRGCIVKTKKATVTAAGVAGRALAIRASKKCKPSTAIDHAECKAPTVPNHTLTTENQGGRASTGRMVGVMKRGIHFI
jgi:hypothetical protein